MVYYPKKQPKKATLLTLATIIGASLLYVVGDLGIGYRAVFQISALLLFAVGIMIMSRYILTDYKYAISEATEADGSLYFIIMKINGQRSVEMAKFDISEIYACKRGRSLKDFEAEYGNVDKVFNYTSNFCPEDEIQIAITFNNKKVLFRIEGEDEFLNIILSQITPKDVHHFSDLEEQ